MLLLNYIKLQQARLYYKIKLYLVSTTSDQISLADRNIFIDNWLDPYTRQTFLKASGFSSVMLRWGSNKIIHIIATLTLKYPKTASFLSFVSYSLFTTAKPTGVIKTTEDLPFPYTTEMVETAINLYWLRKRLFKNMDTMLAQESNYPLFSNNAHWLLEHKTLKTGFNHPFHIVDPSPWPLCTAIGLWYLALSTVAFFHNFYTSIFYILFGILYLSLTLSFWWRDVIRESTFEIKHTPYVRRGLLLGMLLFIISEVMFFFGFFWAYFHLRLTPAVSLLGVMWPPKFIQVILPYDLPFINTCLLLLSGITLTLAHTQLNLVSHYDFYENKKMNNFSYQGYVNDRLLFWMGVTIFLGVFFLACQCVEYTVAPFVFQDTVFANTFYILTGLHGAHVIVGTIFLIVCTWRASRLHFTIWKQVGFKSAAWYWHFVDVVWLFLFVVIYCW